jgi:hypothetical protein
MFCELVLSKASVQLWISAEGGDFFFQTDSSAPMRQVFSHLASCVIEILYIFHIMFFLLLIQKSCQIKVVLGQLKADASIILVEETQVLHANLAIAVYVKELEAKFEGLLPVVHQLGLHFLDKGFVTDFFATRDVQS